MLFLETTQDVVVYPPLFPLIHDTCYTPTNQFTVFKNFYLARNLLKLSQEMKSKLVSQMKLMLK